MKTYEISPFILPPEVSVEPFGEAGLIVRFGSVISPEIHEKVTAFSEYLEKHPFPGMVEYVPAFDNVAIFYDPEIVRNLDAEPAKEKREESLSYRKSMHFIAEAVLKAPSMIASERRTVEIPTSYGGEFGPDLEFVARINGIAPEEVIKIHTEGEYLVYMMGFAPGFPYLGGMSEKIAAPRRDTPRSSIPSGSVGIAGPQTGVYPLESPGGWQLIGRTPLALFRPYDSSPILLRSGDRVKFKCISRKEYEEFRENADER